jgi:hypothetical protein
VLVFRRSLYPRHSGQYTPVPRRTVEGTVETQALRRGSDHRASEHVSADRARAAGWTPEDPLSASRSIFGFTGAPARRTSPCGAVVTTPWFPRRPRPLVDAVGASPRKRAQEPDDHFLRQT